MDSTQHARRRSSSRSSHCSAASVSHSCADKSYTCSQGRSASEKVGVLLPGFNHLPDTFAFRLQNFSDRLYKHWLCSLRYHSCLELQAAAQGSWASPCPETPVRPRSTQTPFLPPVSLTFVPNPSGIGGVLVPIAGKPNHRSSSQQPAKSSSGSPSEEAGSLDSDSNTSSPVSVLPPAGFSPSEGKPLGLSVAPPLRSPSPITSPELLQTPYSPAKPSSGPSTPNLSQTDSCMSETFLLNNNPFSGSIHGAAVCPGAQNWSPNSAVQQLQAGSPLRQPFSPASSQLHQSRQGVLSPPPQLASLLQFQQQPQTLCQSPFLSGGLSSPLLSGSSSYSCASTGVPSLAMGHPVSPPPASSLSLNNPLSQSQLPKQATATSAGSFDFEFDTLCHPMPSMASNLSMTNSTPSASLHDSSWAEPTSFSLMGSTQGPRLQGSAPAGSKGMLQASHLLPNFNQQCFRGSDSNSEGHGSQFPFTFVPARCSSPSVFHHSADLPLSQSMQSQVLA